VSRVPTHLSAEERARWLAQLAEAIEQAQKLTWRMGLIEANSVEAMELYGRLEAARMEVQALRLGGFAGAHSESHPEWLNLLLWEPGHTG
jgi:hypothetical protein